MRLQITKWGNSLAVRLPVECVRAAGFREGDSVDAEITPAGTITLTPVKPFGKSAFLQRLRKLRRGDAGDKARSRTDAPGWSLLTAYVDTSAAVPLLDPVMASAAKRLKMKLAEFS